MVQNSKGIKEYSLKILSSPLSFSHPVSFPGNNNVVVLWVFFQRDSMLNIQEYTSIHL